MLKTILKVVKVVVVAALFKVVKVITKVIVFALPFLCYVVACFLVWYSQYCRLRRCQRFSPRAA